MDVTVAVTSSNDPDVKVMVDEVKTVSVVGTVAVKVSAVVSLTVSVNVRVRVKVNVAEVKEVMVSSVVTCRTPTWVVVVIRVVRLLLAVTVVNDVTIIVGMNWHGLDRGLTVDGSCTTVEPPSIRRMKGDAVPLSCARIAVVVAGTHAIIGRKVSSVGVLMVCARSTALKPDSVNSEQKRVVGIMNVPNRVIVHN